VIVVLAVLALLAAIAVPAVDLLNTRNKIAATREEMENLGESIVAYFRLNGEWPPDLDALAGLVSQGFEADAYKRDAWNRDYHYDPTDPPLRLVSDGANEAYDGGDEDLDIVLYIGLPLAEAEAMVSEHRERMMELADALLAYYGDTGRFPPEVPPDLDACAALVELVNSADPNWRGPYLSLRFGDPGIDPWCQDYLHQNMTYESESYGFADECALTDSQGEVYVVSARPQDAERTAFTRERLGRVLLGVSRFQQDLGRYPTDLLELVTPVPTPGWRGPYANWWEVDGADDGWRRDWDQDAVAQGYVYSWGPNWQDDSNPPLFGGDDIWD
jgi:hypothetical protein